MKIVSSFSHPHVVPNLYVFLSSVEHKIAYFEECCQPVLHFKIDELVYFAGLTLFDYKISCSILFASLFLSCCWEALIYNSGESQLL